MRSRKRRHVFNWKWLVLVAFFVDFYYHASTANLEGVRSAPLSGPSLAGTSSSTIRSSLPRLVVAGTARSVEPHLDKIQKALTRMLSNYRNSNNSGASSFELVQMIWFENNSNDDTVRILQSWRSTDWNVRVISEDLSHMTERTERLAHGRSRLWQEIETLLGDGEAYILMMDMDDVNWHLSNVQECLNLPDPDWSVCCCNSYKVYYDLFALRTLDDWMPGASGSPRMTMPGHQRQQHKPFRHIPANRAPIPVKSCFGGAALYKYNAVIRTVLRNAEQQKESLYVGVDPNKPNKAAVCEHLSFHDKIFQYASESLFVNTTSSALYIQPKFLNDGPSDERMLFFGSVKKRFEPSFRQSWNDPTAKAYYDAMFIEE
jgi:hypothetical protein